MIRVLVMLAMFALAGLNVWLIVEHHGGVMNYIAVAVCLGSGVYGIGSLVRWP